MADFCGKCSMEHFGFVDKPKIDEETLLQILCEGCGRPVWIDHTGYRVCCNECVHADHGTCNHCAGGNFGNTTEICGSWMCNNFERRRSTK